MYFSDDVWEVQSMVSHVWLSYDELCMFLSPKAHNEMLFVS